MAYLTREAVGSELAGRLAAAVLGVRSKASVRHCHS